MFNELFKKYQTSANGLSEDTVAARLIKYGKNILVEKKRTPLVLQFLAEFKDLMVIILIFAAALAFVSGDKKDATVIFAIVLVNATIGFIQKYKADRAIEALKRLLNPKARILRNGKEELINAAELVPGDILILNEGDKVTADAVLFEEHELRANESTLTGESIPVKKLMFSEKENPSCMVFMGTEIVHGTGKAIVVKTGMDTAFGRIADLTTTTKKDLSPLQKELRQIGKFVGTITIIISSILVLIGVLIQHIRFQDSFLFAISVAVAAVPEGLPTTITIALAIGVQHLARKNAIVKQLASVETLGSTTVICSDKTGTLTQNEMTVKETVIDDEKLMVSGVGYEPDGHLQQSKNPDAVKRLAEIAVLCNNAALRHIEGRWHIIGDPTEGALLVFAEKAGFPADSFKNRFQKIYEIPFDSERKRMSVVVKDIETNDLYVFSKGAPDNVLAMCTCSYEEKRRIDAMNDEMANRALRVIAFGWKKLETAKEKYSVDEIECDLSFAGLLGMIDPPREEVKEAVKLTRKAGIKTYIITGDHGLTAMAIARELGLIMSPDARIITGTAIEQISDKELFALLADVHREILFARMNPEHKLRIVTALKQHGHIVAVTGDGVNDAPALKRADIGIAMGITGTDVSKEAANMVLADDSFATIVTAIKEGRTIYENLKKFMYYIFSSNISELVIVFTALAIGMPAPLTAILILMVNVGTDVLPALALGVDPPEKDIMEQRPRNPTDRIMNRTFVSRYTTLGIFMGIIVVAGYFWKLTSLGWHFGDPLLPESAMYLNASTFAFALLVITQMVNTFNARSSRQSLFRLGFFTNKHLFGAIFISIFMTILITETPSLQQWFHTTELDAKSWIIITMLSLFVLTIEEIRKIFSRVIAR